MSKFSHALTNDHRSFLLDLLTQPSPSGWEAGGQNLWKAEASKLADSTDQDAYGNTWAVVEGTDPGAPTLMLEAHADEIGFIIRHIDDQGYVFMAPVGGSDSSLAPARKVQFFTKKGVVLGIIGHTAIHLRDTKKDKHPEWKDLYVDVGASNAAEAAELGIRVGLPGVYLDNSIEIGENRIVGRAIDNRIGGFLLVRILELLKEGAKPAASVIAVNAVQEELGGHGANMIAHRLRPNLALVFDVTHATDTPGMDVCDHGLIKLGSGPTVAHGMANHGQLVDELIAIADRESLPLQHEVVGRTTRTDADQIFVSRDGVPLALLSIPLRYMHSPTELIDLRDVEATAQLVVAFVRSLTSESRFCARGV